MKKYMLQFLYATIILYIYITVLGSYIYLIKFTERTLFLQNLDKFSYRDIHNMIP